MLSSVSLQALGFTPRRSNHYASWAPIYLDLMVGSGERLCIGVVAADNHRSIICSVPGIERLVCIYGRQANAFWTASKLTLGAVEKQVTRYGIASLGDWISPVEGVSVGTIRDGAGENLEDVARVGLMQCASLVAQLTEEADNVETVERAEGTNGRLETLVKDSVIAARPDLSKFFGRSFQASENARPASIGFAGPRLVANFGLLVPGRLAPLVNTAKAKLWDLKQLKSGALSSFLPDDSVREFELLLHRPGQDDPQYSDRQITSLNAAVLELEEEADKVDIRCRPMFSPADIAAFVLKKEAA